MGCVDEEQWVVWMKNNGLYGCFMPTKVVRDGSGKKKW
jgi:hypothetical protein